MNDVISTETAVMTCGKESIKKLAKENRNAQGSESTMDTTNIKLTKFEKWLLPNGGIKDIFLEALGSIMYFFWKLRKHISNRKKSEPFYTQNEPDYYCNENIDIICAQQNPYLLLSDATDLYSERLYANHFK